MHNITPVAILFQYIFSFFSGMLSATWWQEFYSVRGDKLSGLKPADKSTGGNGNRLKPFGVAQILIRAPCPT